MLGVKKIKIAIISDIHGNYPALLAVIKDAINNKVDKFIFAGDYIFDLAYPNEVTELIRSMDNAFIIQGNKEGYLKKLSTENQCNWNFDQMGAVHQTYRDLKQENLTYLMNLSENCFITLPFHGRIYVTHYIRGLFGEQKRTGCSSSRFKKDMEKQPFSHEQFLTNVERMLKENDAYKVIMDIDAPVIILGHSHLQWNVHCKDKLIINPGSCGQPLDFNVMASYTILEDTEFSLNVEEKRVHYDIEQTISFSKTTEIYKRGKIWCELVFLAMRTGADHFSDFFKLAQSIAKERNDTSQFFSNEVWHSASRVFFERIGI